MRLHHSDLRREFTPKALKEGALHKQAGTRLVSVANLTRMCYTVDAKMLCRLPLVLKLDQHLVYVDV